MSTPGGRGVGRRRKRSPALANASQRFPKNTRKPPPAPPGAFYSACMGMFARDWPVAMKCFNYRIVQVLSESMYRESAALFGVDFSRKTPPTPPQCIYT